MHLSRSPILAAIFALVFGAGQVVAKPSDGTATDITGLYYTGTTTTGALVAQGDQDQNWSVTEALVAGQSYSGNSQYTGAAYVVNSALANSEHYIPDTSSAQWITAPGGSTTFSGGNTNAGGNFLPGNGTAAPNVAEYIYTLSFQIEGSDGNGKNASVVGNDLQISLTVAADDDFGIYVNPTLSNGMPTGTASDAGTSSWTQSTTLYLQNYNGVTSGTSSQSANAGFVIGTNTLVFVVTNSNEITGSTSQTTLNPSGLMVSEFGTELDNSGQPVPEVGAWLPIFGALGLVGVTAWRRQRALPSPLNSAGS
jgi:hypothetical protein